MPRGARCQSPIKNRARLSRISLAPEFPVHDLHCLSRVLAARFLPPGEVEDRAHALTGRANATIAHLMYGDEVLGLAFGRLCEEVEQAITFRESLFRLGIRFYFGESSSRQNCKLDFGWPNIYTAGVPDVPAELLELLRKLSNRKLAYVSGVVTGCSCHDREAQ